MASAKRRILLVEDLMMPRRVAAINIKQLDCDVDTAETGAEAITLFKQHHYDLIFMDIGLPDMDGYTVTETIRGLEEEAHAHTPIVALTAHADKEFRENATQSGMDDFLSKPLTPDKAKTVLNKYAPR